MAETELACRCRCRQNARNKPTTSTRDLLCVEYETFRLAAFQLLQAAILSIRWITKRYDERASFFLSLPKIVLGLHVDPHFGAGT